jgi:hypothetical protein
MSFDRPIAVFSSLMAALLLTAVAGCGGGSDLDRFDLSGTVTFDGSPIVYGQIDFIPDKSKGHSGPQGHAQIIDGKYNTAEDGQGVVKGPHEIRITAYPERPADTGEDETAAVEGSEPLFFGYTMHEDLNPPTQDFTVPAEAQGFNILSSGGQRGGGNVP